MGGLLLAACAPERFLRSDEYLLDGVAIHTDDPKISVSQIEGFVRQHPNSRWFSLFKVPLGVYCISGTDSTRRVNRFFRRIGEAPVVYDSLQTERSRANIEAAVRNLGYLKATVGANHKDRHRKRKLAYSIEAGTCYFVDKISKQIDDPQVDSIVSAEEVRSLLRPGMPLDINKLNLERTRITSLLQSQGYYRFSKSYIHFEADTNVYNNLVNLTLKIPLYRERQGDSLVAHPRYHLRNISYLIDTDLASANSDSMHVDTMADNYRFVHKRRLSLRPSFLIAKTEMQPDELYSEPDVQTTYSNISQLSAVLGANVGMEPVENSTDSLDAVVSIMTAKKHALSAALEGTNTAGDFGAAVSLGYQNRNLFRRSALLGLKARGAFEAVKGLEGYSDQNYIEYSLQADLNFPEFMFPFLNRSFRRSAKAQSIASLMFDSQDRPEFHRRVLTAAWRYRWNRMNQQLQHRVDLIDLDYVFMPWISETFKNEYLIDNGNRNAVLRYNYENLFIMRWGYNFHFTSIPYTAQNTAYGQNAYSVRLGIETAGNLLYALSKGLSMQHSESRDAYTLFNIAYAQYVKFDFDFAQSFRIDDRNSLALHAALGAAFPYANSKVLPYEKRYFSGGANSVRGWSVRGLGPGSYSGSDGRVDFIRQTGDLKLDLSAEWRTHLFWKIDGAAFVDAGNIWTFRDYPEQPGGQFRFDTFWKQIAVAYGLGLRLNFSYFILRLDGGMKAINPAHESGRFHYPIIHPKFGRDFQLHFAVGMPF
jgi:outer membrane protein assembly factor BamA